LGGWGHSFQKKGNGGSLSKKPQEKSKKKSEIWKRLSQGKGQRTLG